MQNFQNYSLSSSNGRYIVIDNKQSFPRYASNDSGVSFGDSDNESIISDEYEFNNEQNSSASTITITNDAHLASTIHDDDKKFFCENTAWAWHGEFGRLIMATAMTYNIDYRLMLYDARSKCPRALNAQYSMIQLDNAKAQFKCEKCEHCWTSMRARCSFYISKPNEGGIILLKLFTQQCESCYSIVHPLWYYDEICRVMKNLAYTIFEKFFPDSFHSIYWDLTHNGIRPIRRLLQRKGNMRGQHNPSLCEACHLGVCY
ncbi:unnamed protein product [Adineta steineri]|uniref:3CxxC-type domain-containing protein n=1 Tax=Adineta steineri TaxID=433720 RepID=A0A815RZS2_9BILA|nr:unnamed protein product [Adineta steineri]CAF1469720.1 unnamed protein product [Adineta steineri]CAF1483750.1 unnamed protein product [Adineta steineri]CAF3736353.1 unnamed protein product [Adineta steineri]CAF3751606.1 unnamed protein product [Adineta steineri]